MERLKKIFYSFIILLALGGLLYWLRDQDFGDTIFLYGFAALIALAFFHQTYLLIYDVFHRGITAALNPTEKISAVTEKSEVQEVEKKEMPRWKNIIYSFIAALVIGVFLYYYKPVQRDTFWLYAIGFFILLVFYCFLQTYRLIYDVLHRGVSAALNATDETTTVTKKSDVRKVEGNEMPRSQDSVRK